jgi:hypothetical protein
MPQDFLKPTKIPNASDFGKRRENDGMFHNPPTFTKLGGFTSAEKGKFSGNKMTLERGGPSAKRGRPI